MLVEQLIKETVDMQGFSIKSVKKDSTGFIGEIVPDGRFAPRCGKCGSPGTLRDKRPARFFRHVPLWGIPVRFVYTPRRIYCPACDTIRVEQMPWTTGKQRFTTAFACFMAIWARLLPWLAVARLFKCSWGTVAAAVDTVVEYGLANRDLSGITHIGIDEISRKKGHVYLTNVYDLQTNSLLWSGEGRTKETLRQFFEFLGPDKASHLKGICCDMWQPYIDVIQECAPQAVLVFDKFHIIRHLMDAVDQVRRQEIRDKGKEYKELIKDTRYIWLKNPWNLTDNQKSRLSSLEKLNLKINRAYLLKEAFRIFWSYQKRRWAEKYLKKWFWWATHSRLKPIRNFAWLVRRHEENILSFFNLPINNGTVEGLNNKAKVVSHRAYGFRSARNYIRNLYHCMADLPMPKILHTFV
jgi:transposase